MLFDVIAIIALILSGLLTGVAAGLFGIGGGTILIPLFLTIFTMVNMPHEMMMHVAVATSLSLIIPTAIASSLAQYRRNTLEMPMVKKWIPGICVGVLVGVFLIHLMATFWLKLFFTAYLLFCFLFNYFRNQQSEEALRQPSVKACRLSSFIVGACSTMLGIGGGTFTVPILTFLGYPMKKSVAISALTGFFIGGIGAIIIMLSSLHVANLPPFSLGYVNWLVFLLIAPSAFISSPWGVALGHKMNQYQLKNAYTIFLLVVCLLMLYHLV